MQRLIAILKRAMLRFQIHSLEIHYGDQSETLRTSLTKDDFIRIYLSREDTRAELAKVRRQYNSTLPVGQRKTWRIA